MQRISLDSNWRYFPTEQIDANFGTSELDESSWGVLPTISAYPSDLIVHSGTLNLRRTFDVEPIGETCVSIHLHLDHAPLGTQIFVNGWHVGTIRSTAPFDSDVTDYVSLEDNLLLLKLTHIGDLHSVSLLRIPCQTN